MLVSFGRWHDYMAYLGNDVTVPPRHVKLTVAQLIKESLGLLQS
jgi:hypothetical protein